jgi:hypothetical protein
MRLEHRVGHLVGLAVVVALATVVASAGPVRALDPGGPRGPTQGRPTVEESFDTTKLRLRVTGSGQARLRLRGSGPSFSTPPSLVSIADTANGTLTVDLNAAAARPLRCHVTLSALKCTTGNMRWRVRPSSKESATKRFELTVREIPDADLFVPTTPPLTVRLDEPDCSGGTIELVSRVDSCIARPRTDVYCNP